jgi:YesN/AraC family two-component response regulator
VYSIILVDDETEVRNTLRDCFPWNDLAFHVAGAFDDGQAALNYLQANPVDVVLCDIYMPHMDGLELLHLARKLDNRPEFILISGYRDFEYARRAMKYGVRYYIVKPTKYEELVDVLTVVRGELDERRRPGLQSGGNAGNNKQRKQDIAALIDESLNTITLEDLSARMYMNTNYFSKLFKHLFGEPFSDYIQRLRMERAAGLLGDYRLSVTEISQAVGYANANNFSRAFHNYYHCSPRQYRNR